MTIMSARACMLYGQSSGTILVERLLNYEAYFQYMEYKLRDHGYILHRVKSL